MGSKADLQPGQVAPDYGYGDLMLETQEGPGVWMHVPPRGHLKVVLLQELPLRYVGHWIRGQVIKCPGNQECAWCALRIGRKTRYVYALYDVQTKRAGAIEVGPETASQIRDACTQYGFDPGLCVKLSKRGGVANGAIDVSPIHDIYRLSDLPQGPDLEMLMRRQWSAPPEERG